jgi:sugar phosphate isomerase/epimerase
MRFTLFPKYLAGLSVGELADHVARLRYAGCNVMVREGYWVEPQALADGLPGFVAAMRCRGLVVPIADLPWTPSELLERPDVLRICADAGIEELRPSHINSGSGYGEVGDVRVELDKAAQEFAALSKLAAGNRVRILYQLHHRTLLSSPSAIWPLVRDLPPRHMGVMLDAGNQAIEGFENWRRSLRLLGECAVAVGLKDCRPRRTGVQVPWPWVPAGEGMVDFTGLAEAVREHGGIRWGVHMPFCHPEDRPRHLQVMASEIGWLRACFAE